MPTPTTPNATPERTLGQLVADASHDVSSIVRSEIALAKAEVAVQAKTAGKGVAMFAVAAFVALLALIFLFHTLALVIAIWLPEWAGYLIVTGLLLLVAGVLAFVGKSALEHLNPAPEKTIRNAQETIATLKSGSAD